jgi:hypothetical protein
MLIERMLIERMLIERMLIERLAAGTYRMGESIASRAPVAARSVCS